MICYNCGKELKDGAKFCTKCGAPQTNSAPPEQPSYSEPESYEQQPAYSQPKNYEQQPAYSQPESYEQQPAYSEPAGNEEQAWYTQSGAYKETYDDSVQDAFKDTENAKKKKKKSKTKAIIAIVLVIAILAGGGTASYFLFFTHQKRLERKLKGLTDKEIVEFYFDDYNADGTDEAFAVVGKKGENNEFSKGEIWFVSDNSYKKLKGDVNGRLNGMLEEKKNKYISVEVEDKKDDDSASYIYGVKKKDESYEPPASGQYKGVHQKDDGEIVDDRGIKIDINIQDIQPEPSEDSFLAATNDDMNDLKEKITALSYYLLDYDCTEYDAKSAIEDIIACGNGTGLIWTYFSGTIADVSVYDDSVESIVNKFGGLDSIKNLYSQVRVMPAENVDWILENVLNIKPDRNYTSDVSCYDNDYYYRLQITAGDGGPAWEYADSERMTDGRYKIKIAEYVFDGDGASAQGGKSITGYYEMIAALKDVDGDRVWSVYSMKKQGDSAPVQNNNDDIVGVYEGSYFPAQGETGLTLTISEENGQYKALFEFYNLPNQSNSKEGSYTMTVTYDPDSGNYVFEPDEWIDKPSTYGFVSLEGALNGDVLSGTSPTEFSVVRK